MFIIGLGNPGEKYEGNRHNIGRMFVEWLGDRISSNDIAWKKDSSGSFFYCKPDAKYTLAYPNNFMNMSGIATGRSTKQFSVKVDKELFVAHDDLDIPLGGFKIDFAKGPKLHNGLASIESHLHTSDFFRIRIGVDARDTENRMPGEAYVLNDFLEAEIALLKKDIFPKIFDRLESRQVE